MQNSTVGSIATKKGASTKVDTAIMCDKLAEEFDLLTSGQVTPARARAAAMLVNAMATLAALEIAYHRYVSEKPGGLAPLELGVRRTPLIESPAA